MFGTERMADDLEKAQRKRFEKAKDKYLFFVDDDEAAVYEEIRGLRAAVERELRPRRRPRPRRVVDYSDV